MRESVCIKNFSFGMGRLKSSISVKKINALLFSEIRNYDNCFNKKHKSVFCGLPIVISDF